jgi:hypothetical protein
VGSRHLASIDPPARICSGELYESDVRGHWLTAISWEDEQALAKALDEFGDVYREFQRYERFGPEKLILLSGSHGNP